MKNELVLVSKENFNGVECDFYKQNDEFYMTRPQIGAALGYDDPARAIAKIHERNKERLDRFSRVVKLTTHETGREVRRDMVIYKEQGIYEILMKSDQPRATEFRDRVYEILKGLRTKQYKIIPKDAFTLAERKLEMEIKKQRTAACDRNSKSRLVKLIMSMADDARVSPEAQKSLVDHATSILIPPSTPAPVIGKTYTAT